MFVLGNERTVVWSSWRSSISRKLVINSSDATAKQIIVSDYYLLLYKCIFQVTCCLKCVCSDEILSIQSYYYILWWLPWTMLLTVAVKMPSVVISRPWSRDSSSFCPDLGLETWWPRSRSWSQDLKTQDSMHGAYTCSMITVICSTFKRVLCHQLELMQPVLWSWDHGLETRVHFFSVSRHEVQGLGLGLMT